MKSPVYSIRLKRYALFLTLLWPCLAHARRQLVWEDNFDGPTLNPLYWTCETGDGCNRGNCGWGNQELEYYTSRPENVRLENGRLVIEARRENMGGKPFTSARIKVPKVGTRWSSAFSDPQWIVVDLGADYAINRVKITWETAAARDYEVQLSGDQNSWTTLKAVAGNTALENDHTGLGGHGRYLRICSTGRATPYGYSIFELEAYGTPYAGSAVMSAGPARQEPAVGKAGEWTARLYPNQVLNGTLQLLSSEGIRQLELVDMSGRSWFVQLSQQGRGTGAYPLDVSHLPAGMYLLRLWNAQHATRLLKFMKQ